MRLLYLWQAAYPWDIRVQKITESLSEAGHEVSVLARKDANADPDEELLGRGVRVIRVGGRFSAPVSGSPVWTHALERTLRRIKADALIVRDLPLIVNAVRAARKHRLPLIMDMAEHYPGAMRSWKKYVDRRVARLLVHELQIPDRLERWGVRKVDLIWVVCEEQRERLHREYAVPLDRVVEVRNTPARHWFSETRKGASIPPTVIGHHGNMTPERGLSLLIDAFAKVSAEFPRLRLELAGTGETTLEVQGRIRALGMDGRVKMLGRYLHADVGRLYGQIDLAILPYPPGELVDHTLSNKIFDYMACGKPLLVSGARPMKRLIQETDAGVCFEPWTSNALADRLAAVLRGPLEAMSLRGRRAFETKYHWEKDAERLKQSLGALQRPRE